MFHAGEPCGQLISYVQGNWFGTAPLTSTVVSLTQPVQAGDLLVGWFDLPASFLNSG